MYSQTPVFIWPVRTLKSVSSVLHLQYEAGHVVPPVGKPIAKKYFRISREHMNFMKAKFALCLTN
jgi:hypothetical protein